MATNETRAAIPQLAISKPNSPLSTIPGDCVLRFAEVRQKTGLCRAHVHALAAQGRFLGLQKNYLTLRRRVAPANPINPEPNNHAVVGIGVVVGGGGQDGPSKTAEQTYSGT